MTENIGRLTVFFEDPFWVGVFERIESGRLSVCKVTFGAEPRDCDPKKERNTLIWKPTPMNWTKKDVMLSAIMECSNFDRWYCLWQK